MEPLLPKAVGGRGQGTHCSAGLGLHPAADLCCRASVYADRNRRPLSCSSLSNSRLFLSSRASRLLSLFTVISNSIPRPTICTRASGSRNFCPQGLAAFFTFYIPTLDKGCCWLVSWPRQCPSPLVVFLKTSLKSHVYVLTDLQLGLIFCFSTLFSLPFVHRLYNCDDALQSLSHPHQRSLDYLSSLTVTQGRSSAS